MSFHLQAKLLHVLQDGEYTRLGGTHPVKVDARVMASTNVRLDQAVSAGRFRQDLFFRLNVIRIEVPPLKERREDIPLLTAHFVRRYAARYHRSVRELPRELQQAFLRHDWPGNVRELENAVRRYIILEDLQSSLGELRRGGSAAEPAAGTPGEPHAEPPPARTDEGLSLRKVSARAAEEAERKVLGRVLAETRWNRREAAAQLKISYKALLNKIKKWEVDEPGRAAGREDDGDGGHAPRRGPYPFPAAAVADRPLAALDSPIEAVPVEVIRPRGAWRRPAAR